MNVMDRDIMTAKLGHEVLMLSIKLSGLSGLLQPMGLNGLNAYIGFRMFIPTAL